MLQKMWIADQGDGTYKNPILYTDYSDPDAIRVGEDFFMVASSFCNAPAVPLLHSKDLVNWKVINYIMENVPFECYQKPQHGDGAWAPSIRFHDGVFYVFIPLPDQGILMCKTENPWAKWSQPILVRKVTGWIDPCPFWDEDGKAYMVSAFARSRIGFKSLLYLSPIAEDCAGVLEDGCFIYDGRATQPTIEGPKLYKRNGYYYIFAPAGGVKYGWQMVLRSRNIYGPYEEKIVMHQGNTQINGPHQGAWIDTPEGEDWFLHFQDVGNAGRVVHLQPMKWVDDWPVIGIDENNSGCGEPVLQYPKPNIKGNFPIESPEESDTFQKDVLGLQWQWNANFKKEWYQVGDGRLTLFSQKADRNIKLCDISNLLLQKWPAPEFRITTCLHLEALTNGDVAGMVSLGGCYTGLFVEKMEEDYVLQQRTGYWEDIDKDPIQTEDSAYGNAQTVKVGLDVRKELGQYKADIIYIHMIVEQATFVSFEISEDGKQYHKVGETSKAEPGRWVGVKSGLVIFNEMEASKGKLWTEYFVYNTL